MPAGTPRQNLSTLSHTPELDSRRKSVTPSRQGQKGTSSSNSITRAEERRNTARGETGTLAMVQSFGKGLRQVTAPSSPEVGKRSKTSKVLPHAQTASEVRKRNRPPLKCGQQHSSRKGSDHEDLRIHVSAKDLHDCAENSPHERSLNHAIDGSPVPKIRINPIDSSRAVRVERGQFTPGAIFKDAQQSTASGSSAILSADGQYTRNAITYPTSKSTRSGSKVKNSGDSHLKPTMRKQSDSLVSAYAASGSRSAGILVNSRRGPNGSGFKGNTVSRRGFSLQTPASLPQPTGASSTTDSNEGLIGIPNDTCREAFLGAKFICYAETRPISDPVFHEDLLQAQSAAKKLTTLSFIPNENPRYLLRAALVLYGCRASILIPTSGVRSIVTLRYDCNVLDDSRLQVVPPTEVFAPVSLRPIELSPLVAREMSGAGNSFHMTRGTNTLCSLGSPQTALRMQQFTLGSPWSLRRHISTTSNAKSLVFADLSPLWLPVLACSAALVRDDALVPSPLSSSPPMETAP
ncbi:hypothetical protein OBBRIDRAFT_360485 [Obba rivulosa]|uniref:Uncharacterized protein n=1 Tax=Obba rivulosa TaxID=1052685 RepID=A0A8E2DUG7_9APHY|nr:hypothetical protein OBBRIDRAFT_360485 [Obba rivulosa]